ncbi:MAG: type II toxin-antitoxin system HicA family toxin [Gammaproteobacteria bacterium]|nr:type II toxin-antitoxin system HicA family toxin [Gammaproteobacteria bacterium]MDA7968520.1 type II toxin-antitoxin system HicA family toxin [Gammaproteobacteria bacterium]MDA8003129.1 type II toxin-antitoxin system HicA family toxin [Alphaproteobacteria bacterium]MDA8010647.1 type II toxin-antitoxin system HicA family toxin [Alphaproteobacteria bacterium]MDA8032026.1 type II toxin-antitoxin system HicA family toxin [Alphaproteobacteria bacterium]
MPQFPVISGKELAKFFLRHGFSQRSKKGSHIILTKKGIARPLVIPDQKESSRAVILNNLKIAGLTKADLIAAIQGKKKK